MKKTEITVETHEVVIISRSRADRQAWCPACAARVTVTSPERAAALAGLSPRAVYRLVEAEALHYTETPTGGLDICLNSLLRAQPTI